MIRVLEDLMIRLVVPGLLGFASFVAALVAGVIMWLTASAAR
jgi:hypothetical protein